MSGRRRAIRVFAGCSVLVLIAFVGVAGSEVVQSGNVRVAVNGHLSPHSLPRNGDAPVAVAVGGQITTTDGSRPPLLRQLQIAFNRGGQLTTRGLPVCPFSRLQDATAIQALQACGPALVGNGQVQVSASLGTQKPYAVPARLLLFNGVSQGKPVLFGHVYAARPFPVSFVLTFSILHRRAGTYGTILNATVPAAMRAWGRIVGIEMTLFRRFSYQGRPRSYLAAGCPAPKGFHAAVFPMARVTFRFAVGKVAKVALTRSCRVIG